MADTRSARRGVQPSHSGSTTVTGWVGWVFFAGVMMILIGIFHVIDGLVALFKDDFYVVGKSGLVVSVDYTVWGWVHLLFGIVLILAGFAVLAGRTWARVVGIILASIGAIVNLGFLGAYPIWSVLMIALDVIVIYALAVHGREAAYDRE